MNYFGNNNERSPYTQEGRFNFNPFEEHEIHDPREARNPVFHPGTHPRTPSQPNQSDEDSLYYVRMNQLPPNIARSENIQLMRPKNDSASLNDPFQFGNSPTKIEAKKDGGDFFGFKGIFDKLNPFSKDEEPQNEKAEVRLSSPIATNQFNPVSGQGIGGNGKGQRKHEEREREDGDVAEGTGGPDGQPGEVQSEYGEPLGAYTG
jgi:hypothetical protein